MASILIRRFALLFVLVNLAGCYSAFPAPLHVAAMLDEPGEVHAAVQVGHRQAQGTLAVKVSERALVGALYAGGSSQEHAFDADGNAIADDRPVSIVEGREGETRQHGEIFGGYGLARDRFRLEALGGMGYGRGFAVDKRDQIKGVTLVGGHNGPPIILPVTAEEIIQVGGDYLRWQGTVNVGVASRFFDAAASLRAAVVRYRLDDLDGMSVKRVHNIFSLAPGVVLRPGYKWIKAELTLGVEIPVNSPWHRGTALFRPSLLFGIGVRGHLFRSKP